MHCYLPIIPLFIKLTLGVTLSTFTTGQVQPSMRGSDGQPINPDLGFLGSGPSDQGALGTAASKSLNDPMTWSQMDRGRAMGPGMGGGPGLASMGPGPMGLGDSMGPGMPTRPGGPMGLGGPMNPMGPGPMNPMRPGGPGGPGLMGQGPPGTGSMMWNRNPLAFGGGGGGNRPPGGLGNAPPMFPPF